MSTAAKTHRPHHYLSLLTRAITYVPTYLPTYLHHQVLETTHSHVRRVWSSCSSHESGTTHVRKTESQLSYQLTQSPFSCFNAMQVVANPDGMSFAKDQTKPIGGNIIAHASHTRYATYLRTLPSFLVAILLTLLSRISYI